MFSLGKRRAFTLSELLVVVILTGILAAVAVPKFSRVLETRKTEEAEAVFRVVRTEQEERCTFGKNYDPVMPKQARAALDSSNYDYVLLKRGIKAQSKSKDYAIKMLSYKDGRMCCLGAYCQKLNKDYPLCTDLSGVSYDDNCAADVEEDCSDAPVQAKCCSSVQKWDGKECVAKTFCEINPNDCSCNPKQSKCCSSSQKWDGKQCVAKSFCELNPSDCSCNPNQSKCCTSTQKWTGSLCVNKTACELTPDSCACGTYAAANPCVCSANTCACSSYASANKCKCTPDDCSCKPNQQVCCTSSQKWNGSSCVAKTACELTPDSCACEDYAAANPCVCAADTCQCPAYYDAHPAQCDPESCEAKPKQEKCCDPETQKWNGKQCVAKTVCEMTPESCACQDYADANPCVCAADTCACDTYYKKNPGECDPNSCEAKPLQEKCCDANIEKWDGKACVAKTYCEMHPTDCGCTDYAQANPCECAPTTCACQSYFNQHLGECDPNSCEANPFQQKCCDSKTEKWNGSKCVDKPACEREDQKNTCACGAYAAANPCECEETANTCACPAWAQANKCICTPDDCSCKPNQEKCCNPVTQKWTGSACAAKTPCERDDQKNTCACSDYAAMNFCECDPDGCLCKPNQQQCCQSPAVWDGQFCVIKPADPCDSASTAGTCSCSKYAAQHLCECFPSKENCCGGDKCAIWSGGRCIFQACMDGHMDENCKCVSNCTDSYGPGSSAGKLTLDTCDGNRTSRYTCNGVAKTCTDVYSAFASHIAMASYSVDPFYNFAEDSLAALSLDSGKQTEAADFGSVSGGSLSGGSLSGGSSLGSSFGATCPASAPLTCGTVGGQLYCCPRGMICKNLGILGYECVTGDKPIETLPLCMDGYVTAADGTCVPKCNSGYHYNSASKMCERDFESEIFCEYGYHEVNGKCVEDAVLSCPSGYHLANGKCVKDNDPVVGPALCLDGYHLDNNGICVPDTSVTPVETYYQRTVTCCAR